MARSTMLGAALALFAASALAAEHDAPAQGSSCDLPLPAGAIDVTADAVLDHQRSAVLRAIQIRVDDAHAIVKSDSEAFRLLVRCAMRTQGDLLIQASAPVDPGLFTEAVQRTAALVRLAIAESLPSARLSVEITTRSSAQPIIEVQVVLVGRAMVGRREDRPRELPARVPLVTPADEARAVAAEQQEAGERAARAERYAAATRRAAEEEKAQKVAAVQKEKETKLAAAARAREEAAAEVRAEREERSARAVFEARERARASEQRARRVAEDKRQAELRAAHDEEERVERDRLRVQRIERVKKQRAERSEKEALARAAAQPAAQPAAEAPPEAPGVEESAPQDGWVQPVTRRDLLGVEPYEPSGVAQEPARVAQEAAAPAKVAEKPTPATAAQEPAAAKVEEKPEAKVAEEPAAKVAEEPAAKVAEEPAVKVAEEPAVKVAEKPAKMPKVAEAGSPVQPATVPAEAQAATVQPALAEKGPRVDPPAEKAPAKPVELASVEPSNRAVPPDELPPADAPQERARLEKRAVPDPLEQLKQAIAAYDEETRVAAQKAREAEEAVAARKAAMAARQAALADHEKRLAAQEKTLAGSSAGLAPVGREEKALASQERERLAEEKRHQAAAQALAAIERKKTAELERLASRAKTLKERENTVKDEKAARIAHAARVEAEDALERTRRQQADLAAEQLDADERIFKAREARLAALSRRLEVASEEQEALRSGEAGRKQINAAILRCSKDIQRCVDAQLKRTPVAGKTQAELGLTVDGRGRVNAAKVEGGNLKGSYLETCIQDSARAWRFPASGQEYDLEVPLTLIGH